MEVTPRRRPQKEVEQTVPVAAVTGVEKAHSHREKQSLQSLASPEPRVEGGFSGFSSVFLCFLQMQTTFVWSLKV